MKNHHAVTMAMGTNTHIFDCGRGYGGAGCPVDIRLAPTVVERRVEIPIKLQVASNPGRGYCATLRNLL